MSLPMRGTYTETRRSPAGEGAATDQVADDTRGNGAPRVDTKTGDAPGLDKPGANGTSEDALAAILAASENGNVPEGTGPTARTDTINAVLAILLADHPEAVFYAINANAVTVPMPDSVDLNGHGVVEVHATLDLLTPSYRGVGIDTWEKAQKAGVASAHVRLTTDPDRPVMLHLLDARAQHGVFIGAYTADEQADEQAGEHADQTTIPLTAPSRAARFACARKDGLAVLLEIDEAFTQILGWEPEEVLGRRSRDLIHPDDETLAVDNWMDLLASPGPGRRVKLRHRHRDGSWVWIEVTNHNLLEHPEYQCVVAEMVDISGRWPGSSCSTVWPRPCPWGCCRSTPTLE